MLSTGFYFAPHHQGYCCDMDTNTCFDEDTFTPRNLVCNRGGTKGMFVFNPQFNDDDSSLLKKVFQRMIVDAYQITLPLVLQIGWGQSCGVQPFPLWCKNDYCCVSLSL